MAALPAVRELTNQLANNDIDALLVNIHGEIGQVLTERFDFVFSPTFLVFDASGREILRANSLPRLDEIRLALALERG